jgi:hypothetical protein
MSEYDIAPGVAAAIESWRRLIGPGRSQGALTS